MLRESAPPRDAGFVPLEGFGEDTPLGEQSGKPRLEAGRPVQHFQKLAPSASVQYEGAPVWSERLTLIGGRFSKRRLVGTTANAETARGGRTRLVDHRLNGQFAA